MRFTICFFVLFLSQIVTAIAIGNEAQLVLQGPHAEFKSVPVHLGVMSRCPDAEDCERVFDDVLQEVADIVELNMHYIAQYDQDLQSSS
jgi:hypothetical protein